MMARDCNGAQARPPIAEHWKHLGRVSHFLPLSPQARSVQAKQTPAHWSVQFPSKV